MNDANQQHDEARDFDAPSPVEGDVQEGEASGEGRGVRGVDQEALDAHPLDPDDGPDGDDAGHRARVADGGSDDQPVFERVYHVLDTADRDPDRYARAIRQDAINHGHRPSGDVTLDREEDSPRDGYVRLVFTVPVDG